MDWLAALVDRCLRISVASHKGIYMPNNKNEFNKLFSPTETHFLQTYSFKLIILQENQVK